MDEQIPINEHIPINEDMMPQIKKPFYQKWWFAVIVVVVGIVAVALVRAFGDPVRNDLEEYLEKDLAKVEKLELKVSELYEEAQEAGDDAVMYDLIVEKVMPKSKELIEAAEDVEVETPELREIHEIYIRAVNMQDQGLILILSALEKQDMGILAQANAKLEEARKLAREYRTAVKEFAKKHGMEVSYE